MKKYKSGCYKIRNIINNHCYIGSSRDFSGRKRNHWRLCRLGKHHSPYLQHAWNKYGEVNFVFEIIEEIEPFDVLRRKDKIYINDFRERLINREQYFLDLLLPKYNMNKYARSRLGAHHSLESIRKMTGKVRSLEHRKNIGKARNITEEYRLSQSVDMLEHWLSLSPEQREIRNKAKGRLPGYNHSEESKRKISETKKERRHTERQWESMTPEQYIDITTKMKAGQKKHRDRRTSEQRSESMKLAWVTRRARQVKQQ